jgi:hypothetical protein
LRDTLTAKQERFCLLIIKGETQSKAYVKAGYKIASQRIAEVNASQLMKIPKVQQRLLALRDQNAKKAGISVESITDELMVHNAMAKQLGQISAATGALALAARLHGLLVDQKHVDIVHHKPAKEAVMKDIELSEDEWLRLYKS